MKNNTVIFLVIGVVVLGVLFFLFKPKSPAVVPQNTKNSTESDATQISSPSATPEQGVKIFEVTIKDKKIVTGSETMSVKKGDEVVFKITADRAGEFHLHGYDKDVELEKDVSGELKITANLTGRFGIEFHESETNKYEIGVLEVLPE